MLLRELAGEGLTVQPMVNQIQLHTRLAQEETVRYCHNQNVVVTAFCPLSGSDLEDPVVRVHCKLLQRSATISNYFLAS